MAQRGQWWLVGGVVIASAMGMFYYLRVVNVLLDGGEVIPLDKAKVSTRLGSISGALLVVLAIATIWFGVFPESLFTLGQQLVLP